MRLLGCHLENPFKIILNKTIIRLFVLPVMRVNVFKTVMSPNLDNISFFGIYSYNIDYKNKFSKWEFLSAPYIQVNMFGYSVRFVFCAPVPNEEVSSYGYWESILDVYCNYAYNSNDNFNLYKVIERNTWGKYTNGVYIYDDMMRILKHRGAHRYYSQKGLYNKYKEHIKNK